jgi:integrase
MTRPTRHRDEPTHGQIINALQPGQSARLQKFEYGGSLEARRLGSGHVTFYWRFTARGKTERVPIGPYDSSAPPKSLKPTTKGFSISAAAEAARELAKSNAETPGGLRAERERQQAAERAERAEAAAREKYTLSALCDEYCDWLQKQEKASCRDARNIFANHLKRDFPELAAKPAAQVEKREIVEAVRKLTEAGKMATGRKLRSYLRAAFACAVRADSDAILPAAFIAFGVTTNPVQDTAAIRGKSAKNPLSLADLRRYWNALKNEPGVIGAALRLHLLSGGQRVAQLARLTPEDVHKDWLQLFDPKGRRAEPRPHLLPVTKPMRTELAQLSAKGFVLSTDADGKTAMHPSSLSTWAAEIGKRAGVKDFQLKRVRSGIETALAAARVPIHIRGQLQSHGLGGVQERSYDAHEYLAEKRAALDALHALLERKDSARSNVTPIGGRKRA